MPAQFQSERHDLYLDWLRGLAALLVFLTHVRGGFFVKWSDLDASSQNFLNYFLFVVTRLGREAVVVFFVLSGFLVGGQAIQELRNRRYSLSKYLVARVSRLYTVVVPALFLTAVFDVLHGVWGSSTHGLRSFLINLFFLQDILGPVYGSNAPLWSLSFEWWFYVIFGLGLAGFSHQIEARWKRLMLVAAAAAITMLLWVHCRALVLMFPLWLIGVVARSAPSVAMTGPRYAIPAAVALCIALVISSARWDLAGDYVVGVTTGCLVYSLRQCPPPTVRWCAVGSTLAAFSFSLYALHYPLWFLIQSVLVTQRSTHAGIAQWLELLALACLGLAICYLFYFVFERRTPVVRAWMQRALDKVAGSATTTR